MIPSNFPVFIWSQICASGVIWSWLILALPSVTICLHFSSLHVSQASELHSSIDRILQTTSVSSVDHSFILEWVDVSSKTQCMTSVAIPLLFQCSSIFLPLYSQSVSNSLLFSTWMSCILNQVGSSFVAQIWVSACSSLFFKLDPSTQSCTSVTFPSLLALIPPPSPSYPSFSITFL